MSVVFAYNPRVNDLLTLFFFYLREPPPPSRIQSVPLPPVTPTYETWGYGDESVNYSAEYKSFPDGGSPDHQSTQQWTNGLAQEAESSTGLAITKSEDRENETQSEVSLFFTLLKIMLSINGLNHSQALRLSPVRGATMTAKGVLRKRVSGSP